MSETILNENFPDNGRINVKEYFFKVVRYIGLFAALTIITGVFFYLLKPYYEFWNRKGAVAQSFCVAVFLVLIVTGIYCKKTGKMTPDLLLKLILAAGYVIRLAYMLYTPVSVRQHDTYNRALTGHEAYAWIIYSTGKLPTTNDYQFYHPPLNAFVQAVFMRVTNGLTEMLQKVFGLGDAIPSKYLSGMPTVTSTAYVGLTEYRYYLYSTTQILAVMWSVITMVALVKTLKLLGLKGYTLAAVSAFVVFFPRHIQFSGQVNNDALAYMFQMLSVYYCLRWWKKGRRLYDLLICALCIGLGMMSKISAAVICIPIGCVFAYEFFREIDKAVSAKKNGESGAWNKVIYTAGGYVLFLCVCAPIGLWFQVYAYKTFGQGFGFVFSNLNSALGTTHHNWFERLFITFDPNEYFGTLYCIPFCTVKNGVITEYNNYNLPLYQLRSALFGEFSNYKGGECFSATAFACGLLSLIAFIVMLVYCAVLYFKNGKKALADETERNDIAFIVIMTASFLISEFMFYIKMPYACTMDFRYVMPVILGFAMIFYYARKRILAANTEFGNTLVFVSTFCAVATISLTTLFYLVCSI